MSVDDTARRLCERPEFYRAMAAEAAAVDPCEAVVWADLATQADRYLALMCAANRALAAAVERHNDDKGMVA